MNIQQVWAAVIVSVVTSVSVASAEPPTDAQAARSIISDNCFLCHGPDAATRKADLRLDKSEGLASVIKSDDFGASELLRRITTTDPDEMMPPPDSGLSLKSAERETLEKWVMGGGELARHWSFSPIEAVSPPSETTTAPWIRNEIDAFVLKRLREEGLDPAPRADRESLLRRACFDLTGLPPTVEQLDAFLAQADDGAFEDIVDELLEEPTYGERMALDWLDMARYADTFGYQSDVDNEVWPWRDWLIQAFNDNLPYDDFIRWQVAGDLLPNATSDQVLATAFNRLHRQTNEGGSINEEWRVEYVADRAQTFGTAFLGMTMECARCHDHKYDPISQKDFYSLFAFFDDIDESGLYSHFTRSTPTPAMTLYKDENVRAEHEALLEGITKAKSKAKSRARIARERFEAWLADDAEVVLPTPQAHYTFDDADKIADNAVSDAIHGKISGGPKSVPGVVGSALKFSGENNFTSEDAAKFERTDPFSIACWIQPGTDLPHMVVFHRCMAESDAASRGYELLLENRRPTVGLIHFWPGDAIRVEGDFEIPMDAWTHVAVVYDGSSRAEGVRIFVNGEVVDTRVIRDSLTRTIDYEGGKPNFTLAQRMRDNGFKDGLIDELRIYDREISAAAVQTIYAQENTTRGEADGVREFTRDELQEHYLLSIDEPYRNALEALHEARVAEHTLIQGQRQIMVMRDMATPREAYLLERGSYELRKEPVEPSPPEEILPFSDDLPRNRLGLAEWLVDPRNPLTARVAVNRYWQLFFGQGLVRTQEDFGNQGGVPSHPELLDFLAQRFIDSGWDVKALCKYIVSSATYQQVYRSDLQDRDPENVLLASGPRHRLKAEQIRDAALAASGLLVPAIGGPSVKPYQPEGLWSQSSSAKYTPSEGDGLYRRSMYTFIKRTVPPPSMVTFDAPGREVCRARRERTATPLQALVLLNDPQYVEAARVLAERTLAKHGIGDAAMTYIFRALTSRTPTTGESAILTKIVDEQRAAFQDFPDQAAQYLATGASPRDESIDAVEAAAYTALAQAVMNFDAFQVKP